MKKQLKYIFLLFGSALAFTSCLPEEGEERLKYDGPTVVEFKNHTLGIIADSRPETNGAPFGLDWRGVISTGQTDSTRTISLVGYTVANSATATAPARMVRPRVVDTVLVQLVGPQRSTDTEVRFETFDATLTNATTGAVTAKNAVEGTDYTFEPAGARTVIIPANSSVGRIIIRPNAASFTGTERKRLGLRLLGASDAAANPNYDTFYVTMTRTN